MTKKIDPKIAAILAVLVMCPVFFAITQFHAALPGKVSTPPDPASSTGVLTYHNDNQRTGQNLFETTLTTQNVTSAMFGKLFVINVDGAVDAQPLYAPSLVENGKTHNVLYVAT